jgi:hypothetical protein
LRSKEKGLPEGKPLIKLVAKGGIEPPTQGFSIRYRRLLGSLQLFE